MYSPIEIQNWNTELNNWNTEVNFSSLRVLLTILHCIGPSVGTGMQRMGVEIVVGNLQINYVFEITGNEGGKLGITRRERENRSTNCIRAYLQREPTRISGKMLAARQVTVILYVSVLVRRRRDLVVGSACIINLLCRGRRRACAYWSRELVLRAPPPTYWINFRFVSANQEPSAEHGPALEWRRMR